jgi:hypothetical protein
MKLKIESEIEVNIDYLNSFINKDVYKDSKGLDKEYIYNQIYTLFHNIIQDSLYKKVKELAKSNEENSHYPWLEHHLETDIYLSKLISNNLKISEL